MLLVTYVVILVLVLWICLDFYLGRQKHLKENNKLLLPPENGDATFYAEGEPFFSALFDDLNQAKSFIYVQFYIIRNDSLGKELFQILEKKAAEGVEVYLLADAIGSRNLSSTVIKSLRKAGVSVAYTERPHFPYFFYSLNRRNHRKISIIDGRIAYIGGNNVGVEYLGRDPKLGHWRDYHMKLTGKIVDRFFVIIGQDWEKATNKKININTSCGQVAGKECFQLFATDGQHIDQFFLYHIKRAKKTIFIGTPYFIPGRQYVQELKEAMQRGVLLTILIPLKSDHLFVKEAAYPYLLPLLKAGAEVYRYNQGFYHAKVFMVDHTFCDIGTANFDKRSFYLNNEVNCLFTSPHLIQTVWKVLEFDLQQSQRLTILALRKRSLLEKGKTVFAMLVSRFL